MENPTKSKPQTTTDNPQHLETAYLAGGCYWGMEDLFRKQKGVLDTDVGFMGGHLPHATYSQVKTGRTGHAETLQIIFDPQQVSYRDLLIYFFRIHNPTTKEQQGNDIGSQYRSAIFYLNDDQKNTAMEVIGFVNQMGVWKAPVVTEVILAGEFWRAEESHQDYLEKNPDGYTCHFERQF